MGLVSQGLILLATGMVAVFVFLMVLIFVVQTTSKFAHKLSYLLPDPESKGPAKKLPVKSNLEIAIAVAMAAKRAGLTGSFPVRADGSGVQSSEKIAVALAAATSRAGR